ncbi:hypothetical protein KIM372_06120 [Bombiscardovia nodaiensis]|uniref:Protein kinase domain-containing protein n=1 Tax=Bombiscardovia nodaiensis TaxID=2932181 RepID=A0ABN6SCR0_9BIFI|nr:hypothetical protein KIM372_06120 [Bombiscardovia nodaiensis]
MVGSIMVKLGNVVGSRYQVLAQIGSGGMSTVYLAMDTTLNKQWALKEIRHIADRAHSEVIVKSLVAEANLIKSFDHPAIPRIVDLIEEGGSLYIVMDYIEGQTLQKLLDSEGAQSEASVVSWGVQLCDALDYLHNRQPPIVYRDMKPSNVMVTPEGQARIIDFGIACPMPPAEGPLPKDYEPQLGTPGFAAPEQYDEQGRADARTDVYGLAAVLYVMLTGQIIEGQPYQVPPLRQVKPAASASLEAILLKAMQRSPDQRYRTCAEFAYALEHYSLKDSAHTRSLKRRWVAFCSVCALAVVCALGGGSAVLAEGLTLNSDYGHQMQLAQQTTDDQLAERHYAKAASLRPKSTEPYQALISRYRSDSLFDKREEGQLQQLLADHSDDIRSDASSWGALSFDIGKLYWYYYYGGEQEGAERSPVQLQYARMRAASSWMKEASQRDFPDRKLARLYATIADFNISIVPLINEGSDTGKYAPYLHDLDQFIDSLSDSKNDVMRLSVVTLTLEALRTYPRKFRADGVPKSDLTALTSKAQALASQVHPTTVALQNSRQAALQAVPAAEKAVEEAFVDINGNGGGQ